LRRTEIVPWTKKWIELYSKEKYKLTDIFKSELVEIYHIGSTSIQSIRYAKPIIDILIVVTNIHIVDLYHAKMKSLGYEARGENGITGRRYFTKGNENRTHHVHIYQEGHENIIKHLLFKEYLLHNPEEAKNYGKLKLELSTTFPHDTHLYQEGKEPFVTELVRKSLRWNPIKKAYGYVTRVKDGKTQLLVFRHPIPEAGIQIPKGTVEPNEDPYHAVSREIEEETGLRNFQVEKLIAEDYWESDDGVIHNRFFYKLHVTNVCDEWDYDPTGGGAEEGLVFHYFWISSKEEVEIIRGHSDYFDLIFV